MSDDLKVASVTTPVVMPQMGLEVTEATVTEVRVVVGAKVSEGEPLVEVETDKALTEVPSPIAGVVEAIHVEVGDTIEVGAQLISIGSGSSEPAAADVREAPSEEPTEEPNGRVRAAPVARRAAERLGIPIASVKGTGPNGRVTLSDVEAAASSAQPQAQAAPPPPKTAEPALEPMSPTRRSVARRMTASALIPQFTVARELDATWLLAEKERLAADGTESLSINDLLVQAFATTVERHPDLATSYVEAKGSEQPQLRRAAGVDVGLAVATDRGLLVPVLRRAHERSLTELARERARLVDAARAGALALEEMSGATVTLSNLGGVGVDRFTAMINPGESAILAVGRMTDRVVPRERGIAVVPMLTLTLTLDHRVVDGAAGGAALHELAELLEGTMEWRP